VVDAEEEGVGGAPLPAERNSLQNRIEHLGEPNDDRTLWERRKGERNPSASRTRLVDDDENLVEGGDLE
jgi:hypothetical protein